MKTIKLMTSLSTVRKIQTSVALFAAVVLLSSFTYYQTKPWNVPEANAKKANPVKGDEESLKNGKALWVKHCQSCHGKKGLGDGTKAAQLDTEMDDLSSDVVQKQSDGALFYKIQTGRDEMPTFKKKIPDEDEVWQLVNFIRSLKVK